MSDNTPPSLDAMAPAASDVSVDIGPRRLDFSDQSLKSHYPQSPEKSKPCCSSRTKKICLCLFLCIFLTLGILVILAFTVFKPKNVSELTLCSVDGCEVGEHGSAACGQKITQVANDTRTLTLDLTVMFNNPNRLSVELTEWSLELLWSGDGWAAARDSGTLPSGSSSSLAVCTGTPTVLKAQSDVYVGILCRVQLGVVLARALEAYYHGRPLKLEQKLDAKLSLKGLASLFTIKVKYPSSSTFQEDMSFGDRIYLFDEAKGTLVDRTSWGIGGVRPPPALPGPSSASEEPSFWGGKPPTCKGTSDLPLVLPSLAMCDLAFSSVDVFRVRVTMTLVLRVVNMMGIPLVLHDLDINVYRQGETESLGRGSLADPQVVAPFGASEILGKVDISLRSTPALFALVAELSAKDPDAKLELDGSLEVSLLTMDLALDLPRISFPLAPPQGQSQGSGSAPTSQTSSLYQNDSVNFLMGQCTCLYKCSVDDAPPACPETGGCFYQTGVVTERTCPAGTREDPACTSARGGLVDFEYCCPTAQCSTNTGCYYETSWTAQSCPAGYTENADCTAYGFVTDEEFCCPTEGGSPPSDAAGAGDNCSTDGGCFFHTDVLAWDCPAGTTEVPPCTATGLVNDEEFCCPN